MFTSRKIIVMFALVAFLSSMIAVFHVETTEAHRSWCTKVFHRPHPHNPFNSTNTERLNQRSISGTCSLCGGSATLTSWRERIEVKTTRKTEHRDLWEYWSSCHSHETTKVRYTWSPPTVTCHNPNCGG